MGSATDGHVLPIVARTADGLGEDWWAATPGRGCLVEAEQHAYWDAHAATFDQEADHGLTDPLVARAWTDLLVGVLPNPRPVPARIADLGAGTGSLAVLLAGLGHRVWASDASAGMVRRGLEKTRRHGVEVAWSQGDAAEPAAAPRSMDVVLVRHVLWALPDPDGAMQSWGRLLRPDGRLVLVEGRWGTGAGIPAAAAERIARQAFGQVHVQRLEHDALWGRHVEDERYLVVAREPLVTAGAPPPPR